jgi:hypothetical protein
LISRRGFILVLSAPAIVTASNLMPIKQYRPDCILPYKGKQLVDAAFFYAPYVPVDYDDIWLTLSKIHREQERLNVT